MTGPPSPPGPPSAQGPPAPPGGPDDDRLATLEEQLAEERQARTEATAVLLTRIEDLAALATDLLQARSDIGTLGVDLDNVVERLTAIETTLRERTLAPLPGTPIVWHELTAVQEAGLWPRFTAWVVWLADTYQLGPHQLPRCWYQHGGVVQELTDLWTSFLSAHNRDQGDAGSAPYLWQDALGRTLERSAGKWLGPCVNGIHQPRDRAAWNADADYLATLGPLPSAPTQPTDSPEGSTT